MKERQLENLDWRRPKGVQNKNALLVAMYLLNSNLNSKRQNPRWTALIGKLKDSDLETKIKDCSFLVYWGLGSK